MSPTTQRLAGMIAAHLPHRPRPVRFCGPGIFTRTAVNRHGNGVMFCPECGQAGVQVESFMNGKVRVLPHERLSSTTVRVVGR